MFKWLLVLSRWCSTSHFATCDCPCSRPSFSWLASAHLPSSFDIHYTLTPYARAASPSSQLSDESHGWNSVQSDIRRLTDWLQSEQSLCSPTHATVLLNTLMRLTLPAAPSSSSAVGVVVRMCLSHLFLFSLWVHFFLLLPGVSTHLMARRWFIYVGWLPYWGQGGRAKRGWALA